MNLNPFTVAADDPGNRLVLERQEPPPGAAGCLAGLAVVLCLAPVGVAYLMALDLGGLTSRLVLLLGAAITLGLTLYVTYRARRSRVLRRISVDRRAQRLDLVEGPLFEGAWSLGVAVATLRCQTIRSKNSTSFRCDVVAHLGRVSGEPRPLVLVSTRSPSDPTVPYRPARSLVMELARALERPHRVTPYA